VSCRRHGSPAATTGALLAVGVSVGVAIGPLAAEPCRPRAQLVGDRDAVAAVSQELARLGVDVASVQPAGAATPASLSACRTLKADVELDREGGIAVAIVDGAQRSEGRVVSDATVAAAWIESFARDDVDGFPHNSSGAPGTTTAVISKAAHAAPKPNANPDPTATPAETPGVSVFERFGTSVALEQAWPEGEGVRASGFAAAICARVGSLCFGVRARYASEADRAVNLTAMGRSDVSALATASAAFTLGHLTIVPELGLGAGRMATRRIECLPAPPPNCDPSTDPTCDPNGNNTPPPGTGPDGSSGQCPAGATEPLSKLYVGDNLDVATYTPRAAAALRVAVPLFDHVWLEGAASFELAPLGHSADFTTIAADGTASKDSALPGEPVDIIRLGIGLRVGAP
jgi:hypothetical protein